MALIKCPECGKEFSDKATACPNCGAPNDPVKPTPEKEQGNAVKKETSYAERYRTPNPKGKKKGGVAKWIVIILIILFLFALFSDGSDDTAQTADTVADSGTPTAMPESEFSEEAPAETETVIEYISVTADAMLNELSENAMKAEASYEEKYIEVTGEISNFDSDGKYISITGSDFSLSNIQCYIKTEDQKSFLLEKSVGDTITVKGFCKDVGELLGYQIDIDSVE